MRVLHLSDIHLNSDKNSNLYKFFKSALIKDLISFHEKKKFDFIAITGDIIDKGGASFDANEDYYKIFHDDILKPICDNLKLDIENVLMSPGNHDTVKNIDAEIYEEGLQSKLTSVENINSYCEKFNDSEDIYDRRTEKFNNFNKEFYKDQPKAYLSNFESCFIKELDQIKIGFACFNSSWRCSPELPEDKLVVGTNQFINAKNYFEENKTNFNIGLIHHPIEYISQIEQEEVSTYIQDYVNILLIGHSHNAKTQSISNINGNTIYSNSKSAFNNPREKDSDYKSGYTIMDVDFIEGTTTIHNRVYSSKRFLFVIDSHQTDPEGYTLHQNKLKLKSSKKKDIEIFDTKLHYDRILETISNPQKIITSRFYCKRNSFINEINTTLDKRGIVVIEGPMRFGKTFLIDEYRRYNKIYKFPESIPHDSILIDKQKELSVFADSEVLDETPQKASNPLIDLYVEWGAAIIWSCEDVYKIKIKNNRDLLKIIKDKSEFYEQIKRKQVFVDGENYLECMLLVIKEFLGRHIHEPLLISAHLDDFQKYADSELYSRVISDLRDIDFYNINKGSSLNQIKLLVTTRYFPIYKLKNLVLRVPELLDSEVSDMLSDIVELKDEEEKLKFSKEIIRYTAGHVWFINRFFKLYCKKRIDGDQNSAMDVLNDIFTNPNYWTKDFYLDKTEGLSEILNELHEVFRDHSGKTKDDFFKFIAIESDNLEEIEKYKSNRIAVESGWIRLKKEINEVSIKGLGNWIMKNHYSSKFIKNNL